MIQYPIRTEAIKFRTGPSRWVWKLRLINQNFWGRIQNRIVKRHLKNGGKPPWFFFWMERTFVALAIFAFGTILIDTFIKFKFGPMPNTIYEWITYVCQPLYWIWLIYMNRNWFILNGRCIEYKTRDGVGYGEVLTSSNRNLCLKTAEGKYVFMLLKDEIVSYKKISRKEYEAIQVLNY